MRSDRKVRVSRDLKRVGALVLILILSTSFDLLSTAGNRPDHSEPYLEHTHTAMEASSGTSPNGDGSSNISYWDAPIGKGDVRDTWIDGSATTSIHGGDSTLVLGWDPTTGERRNALIAIDLDAIGFWTNATIQSATVELNVRTAANSPMDVEAWMTYVDWDHSDATWESTGIDSNEWNEAGALGRFDSGGIRSNTTLKPTDGKLRLDVTQAFTLAQARLAQGSEAVAALVLMTPTQGVQVTLDSSLASFWDLRPLWNVTVRWSSPPMPSNSPAWIDIDPKAPISIPADGQRVLKASVRNEDTSISSEGVSWSVDRGTIQPSGEFLPSIAGRSIVTATGMSSGLQSTRDLTVVPGSAQSVAIEPSNATFTSDDEIVFRALMRDAHGNEFDGEQAQWWADSGSIAVNGSYTISDLGTHRVDVLVGALSAWTNVTIGEGSAHSIEFDGTVEVAAGESIQIVPTVKDRLGNELNSSRAGSLTWSSEEGSVDGSGWYTGIRTGVWTVWCNGSVGVTGSVEVRVTVGELSALEILAPNGTVGADNAIPLPVLWRDALGNEEITLLPLSHWSAEDGGFRLGTEHVEWLPRSSGEWIVTVQMGNLSHSVNITVGHGVAERISIDSASTLITADDVLEMRIEAQDSRGNRWLVQGDWEIVEDGSSGILTMTADGTSFEAALVGHWTIRATTEVNGTVLEALRIVEVAPGRLSSIELNGSGQSVTADDLFDLSPVGLDADGNLIDGLRYNWSIDGIDATDSLRESGGIWNPSIVGDVTIEASAAGRAQRVTIQVTPGTAHSIQPIYDGNQNIVRSGESLTITLVAADFDGNERESDADWDVPTGSATVEEGDRVGRYEVTGLRSGSWLLIARSGSAEAEVHITVEVGDPQRIEVRVPSTTLRVGEPSPILVEVTDAGGNRVEVDPTSLTIESESSDAVHSSGDEWLVTPRKWGEGLPLHVHLGNVTGTAYLDIEPDALGYMTGTSAGRAASFSLVTALVVVTLVIILRMKKSRVEVDDDEGSESGDDEDEIPYSDTSKMRDSAAPTPASTSAGSDNNLVTTSRRGRRQRSSMGSVSEPSGVVGAQHQLALAASNSPVGMPVATGTVAPPTAPSTAMFASTPINQQTPPVEATPVQPSETSPPPRRSLEAPEATQILASTPAEGTLLDDVTPAAETQPEAAATADEPADATAIISSSGVLLACEGTTQGATGWYHDGQGNVSCWQVDEAGGWTRID